MTLETPKKAKKISWVKRAAQYIWINISIYWKCRECKHTSSYKAFYFMKLLLYMFNMLKKKKPKKKDKKLNMY